MGRNYKDVEKILTGLAKENPEKMDAADPISDDVFERIEYKAFNSSKFINKNKRNSFVLRAVASAFAIFAVFTAVLYFSDMPMTSAKEDPNVSESESVTLMPSSVDMPKYIPERFVLDGVAFEQYHNWFATVLTYINPKDEEQYIKITVDGKNVNISPEYEREISLSQKNGLEMVVTIYESDFRLAETSFIDAKGRMVQILGTLTKQELLDIADGID